MKKTKIIAALMVVFTLITVIVTSCSDVNTPGDKDTVPPTDEPDTAEETVYYPYAEGDYSSIGEFRMLVRRDGYWGQDYDDLFVEYSTGDYLDSAVYNRNAWVEEKYKIKIVQQEETEPSVTAKTLITAGDGTYHIVQDKLMNGLAYLAVNDLLHNYKDIPNMNLEAPWYNQNLISAMSINNFVPAIGGDICISDKMAIMSLLMNLDLANDLSIGSIYETVDSGAWTIDKLWEYARAATKDLDGDSEYKKDDQWGFIVEDFGAFMLWSSSGEKIADKDSDDLPVFKMDSERSTTVIEKVFELMFDTSARGGSNWSGEDFEASFGGGRSLIAYTALSSAGAYRQMDDSYAIIPMPKYDEAQAEYCANVSPFVCRTIYVPNTADEATLEMIGAVLDSMSRESSKVQEAYYDILLSEKVARDDDSKRMLAIQFGNINYDIGAAYNWNNCWFIFSELMSQKSNAFTSKVASVKEAVIKKISETVEVFGAVYPY